MPVPNQPPFPARAIWPRATWRYLLIIGLPLLILAGFSIRWVIDSHRDTALLTTPEIALQTNRALLAHASQRAPPLYQQHCASCHGDRLQGDIGKGAPNLVDAVWLYGNGAITDIEQTILYGIRSGHPKSRNLTDMPGLGRQLQITPAEVSDVVDYVLQLSAQPHDAAAAARGALVFADRGACYDCHGGDGYGEADYGAPNLTGRGNAWLYGGDRNALYKSVFDGRHGLCPAWIQTLSFTEIRALAGFIYSRSHRIDTQSVAQAFNAPSTSSGS